MASPASPAPLEAAASPTSPGPLEASAASPASPPPHPVPVARSRTLTAVVGTTTTLRLALTPVVAALALTGQPWPAAAVFAIAAGTDYLDGFLARRWRVATITGSFLDTTADKVLVAGVLIALTSLGQASPWPVMIIVCREVMVMGLRGSVAASGQVMRPSSLGKSKATLEFVALILLLLRVNRRLGPTGIGEWALWAAAALAVISAGDYVSRWAGITLRSPRPARPS